MQLSNMAQRKRAGLITRRTLDRNQVLLRLDHVFGFFWGGFCFEVYLRCDGCDCFCGIGEDWSGGGKNGVGDMIDPPVLPCPHASFSSCQSIHLTISIDAYTSSHALTDSTRKTSHHPPIQFAHSMPQFQSHNPSSKDSPSTKN